MKKFFFAAVATLAMVACGGNQAATENEAENAECTEVCEAPLCIETLKAALACDNAETAQAALAEAEKAVSNLLVELKNGEAYSLADAVELAIAENAENLNALGVDYTTIAEVLKNAKALAEANEAEQVVNEVEAQN